MNFDNFDISYITEWIDQEKCVIILGPDFAFDFKKSLLGEFNNFLNLKKYKSEFNEKDDFFDSHSIKPMFYQHLSRFFKSIEPTDFHKKIAEIPFHLIISSSPDVLLSQIFDEKSFDYTFDYYDKNMNPQPIAPLSKDKPLIYNLLGVQNMFNSLVLTFNQLFDYLASILGDHKLSDGLKKQLQEAQSILFLGFKFNKWYYKLIFRLLGFYENAMYQAPMDEIEQLNNDEIYNFYVNEFNFQFIDVSGEQIITKLYEHYKDLNQLRKPKSKIVAGNVIQNITNNNINIQGNGNIVANDIKDSDIDIKK
ncbi:MAG: SIR2 family protein [Bacteroidales bacterium]|nr:SIR2 family protein [Bacteroidales bacterium]